MLPQEILSRHHGEVSIEIQVFMISRPVDDAEALGLHHRRRLARRRVDIPPQ